MTNSPRPASKTNDAPKRALVLAGGGMRVAWQAGAIRALAAAGLEFDHVDGTSGGIMNTASLLSGVSPESLCDRWSTVDVKRFVSLLPWRRYLKAPNLLSFGDADGVTGHIFPHLGIDIDLVRRPQRPVGTFNVCNFDDKVSVAIPNEQVTIDHLVAGMSLPIAMPPVRRDGVTWTDAVWIRDANLTEAVERGATEIWLLWCIGNTPRYGEGPLEQYVHMIEMSAAGALNAELATIAKDNEHRETPVRVHVVKPQWPLPLDPEFMFGRIDAHTLVCMGHRDAQQYLAGHVAEGVALDAEATKMTDASLGVRFRDTASGELVAAESSRRDDRRGANGIVHAGPVTLRVGAELHEINKLSLGSIDRAPIVGSLRFDRSGLTAYLTDGVATLEASGDLTYEATFEMAGLQRRVWCRRQFSRDQRRASAPKSIWLGLSSIDAKIYEDERLESAGVLRSQPRDIARLVLSVEPSGAHGLRDRAAAVTGLLRILRSQWRSSRRVEAHRAHETEQEVPV